MSSFKKQIMNFIATNRTVMSVQESQGAKDDVIAAYVAGAKGQAAETQRIGEILERLLSNGLTPQESLEVRSIFTKVKEVVDPE